MKNVINIYKELLYFGEWYMYLEDNLLLFVMDLCSWYKVFVNKVVIVVIVGWKMNWWGFWINKKVIFIERLYII